uniref:Uncharacterized protein n=1 Tax=Aegilops tauschii subsp. strangulata TaxID=200361 RepID=A0A453PJ22_AEGTS
MSVVMIFSGFCGVACNTKTFSHVGATRSRIDLIVLKFCHEITLMCTVDDGLAVWAANC